MRKDQEYEIGEANSLLDVLLIMQKNIMRNVHVATLAYLDENIKQVGGEDNSKYGIWKCKPFPLIEGQESYSIQGYYFNETGNESDNGLSKGKIVIILFMDRNFINNLNAVDENPKQTQDTTIHSLKFGVILNSI